MMGREYKRIDVDVKSIRDLYALGLTIDEVAETLDTTPKVIYSRMVKHGIQRRNNAKRNQYGDKNSSWKGNEVGYSQGHFRVYAHRGRPQLCEMCGVTTAKRFEWDNINGNYFDPCDYRRLCSSCHHKLHKLGLNFHRGRNARLR